MTAFQSATATNHYATRVRQVRVGDSLDALFDAGGASLYTLVYIDHDLVTDVDAMLAYCRSIKERGEQGKPPVPPLIVVYYSRGIDWRNFGETVKRYSEYGISSCFEKEGDALVNLEEAVSRYWAEQDARHEAHMRSLFQAIPEQEGEWQGQLTYNDCRENTFNFETLEGTFVLRGGEPEKYIGRPMHSLTVRGKVLAEKADAFRVQNLLPVLAVAEIIADPLTDEEIQRNIEEMGKGPFLGRLNHPEIFGDNPDLYGPITPEQMHKMLSPENYGYERFD